MEEEKEERDKLVRVRVSRALYVRLADYDTIGIVGSTATHNHDH